MRGASKPFPNFPGRKGLKRVQVTPRSPFFLTSQMFYMGDQPHPVNLLFHPKVVAHT
jgi:hypothetical protein